MGIFDSQMTALLSGDLFRQIFNNEPLSLIQFNFLTNALIKNNIPFDVAFDSGSRKEAPALELTIHINPSATFVLVVSLAPGSNAFSDNS